MASRVPRIEDLNSLEFPIHSEFQVKLILESYFAVDVFILPFFSKPNCLEPDACFWEAENATSWFGNLEPTEPVGLSMSQVEN